jgi:phosphohistidine phosphatase
VQIYLLRHAIAESRDPDRFPDDALRPLTREGRAKMARAVRGMKSLGLRFDLVLTSPLMRARQTARLVVRGLRPEPPLKVLRPLASGGGTGGVVAGLSGLPPQAAVLLVGHEPDLSQLAGALVVSPRADLPLDFKKGALLRIDFQGPPRPGEGVLIFHLPPRVLRGLARGSA